MATRGKRLYECRDCRHKQFVHWRELNRSSMPRCVACGGALDAASAAAKDDQAVGSDNLNAFAAASSSVVRGKSASRRHRT